MVKQVSVAYPNGTVDILSVDQFCHHVYVPPGIILVASALYERPVYKGTC